MQTNQSQTKTHHPMAAAMLANLEASTPRKVERMQADSIYAAKMAAKAQEAKVIADVKLYTPAQNEATSQVLVALYEILKLTDMVNTEIAVWNLGLPKLTAYSAGDMLGVIEDHLRILHQIAAERGVKAVLDNKGGASQYKELQNRREHLESVQEKTAAYYKSKQIQKQKEAA